MIERHLIAIGFIAGEGLGLKSDPKAEVRVVGLPNPGGAPQGQACPNCGSYALQMKEGCMTCNDCGHSKCG